MASLLDGKGDVGGRVRGGSFSLSCKRVDSKEKR